MRKGKQIEWSKRPAGLTRLMISLLLLLSILSLCASALAQGADRGRDIVTQIQGLQQQMQACGSDMSCIAPIQQQIEALAKQYSELHSELTSSGGPQPVIASTEECPPSYPCCGVEQSKQWARKANGVDPTWVEAKPTQIKMVWDFHEADENNDIRFSLTYEFTGCLMLVYDQQKKGVLESFDLYGPSTSSLGSCHLDSISAKLTAVNWITLRALPVNSANPSDFVIHHSADLHQPKPYLVFKYSATGGAEGRLGAYGPLPKDTLFPEDFGWRGMNFASYTYSQLKPEQCITLKEIQQAMETGNLVKQIQLRDMSEMSVQSARFWHLEEGTVTITVSLKPLEPGTMEVIPGDAFKSTRPDPKQPFSPLSKTYTLRNTGEKPINYAITKTANWMNIDKASGTIPPKGTAEVSVSVNVPVASKLLEDTYQDTVVFTNTTDGKGSTTRLGEISLAEEQTWRVFLSGMDLDDMGGTMFWLKEAGKIKQVTFDYGVRFDFKLGAEFTIKKVKGKWKYATGIITEADVKATSNYDKEVFDVTRVVLKGGAVFSALKGSWIGGHVGSGTVQLIWPNQPVGARVYSKLKLAHDSKEQSHKGEGINEFASEDFVPRAASHQIPLKDGPYSPQPVKKTSAYYKFSKMKRTPVHVVHHYQIKRIK